jgi:hypothetical protein
MSHALDGARAKLRRATEHLDAFEVAAREYLESNPIEIVTSDEPESDGLRRIRWVASASVEPPAVLGLIVGDWANNTRTALDYIVYELVRRETGKDDPGWTHFPIVTTPSDHPGRATKQLRGAPGWSLPVFEGLQPFHDAADDAGEHPLAVLAAVSNRDKHRLIHTAAMQFAGSQGGISGTSMLELHEFTQNPGTVSGERTILDALLKTDGDDFEIHLNLAVTLALEDYPIDAIALMEVITGEVNAILEWFSPALD